MSDRTKTSNVYCWTQWANAMDREDLENVVATLAHTDLKQGDQKFGWKFTHVIGSIGIPERCCRNMLHILRKRGFITQIAAKDRDGDTPIHSAVRSRADSHIISLLLHCIESYEKRLLLSRNKKGETVLELAFEMHEWETVQVLLEGCIENRVLAERTGVDAEANTNTSTLLHKAMKRGELDYLRVYLTACRKCKVDCLQGLQATNRKGRTPWCYLMNHTKVATIKEALVILAEFEVDINDLYTDPASKTTMLHDAYRKARSEAEEDTVVRLLLEAGADPNKQDVNHLIPSERQRKFPVLDSERTSPTGNEVPDASLTREDKAHLRKLEKRKRRRQRQKQLRAESITEEEASPIAFSDTAARSELGAARRPASPPSELHSQDKQTVEEGSDSGSETSWETAPDPPDEILYPQLRDGEESPGYHGDNALPPEDAGNLVSDQPHAQPPLPEPASHVQDPELLGAARRPASPPSELHIQGHQTVEEGSDSGSETPWETAPNSPAEILHYQLRDGEMVISVTVLPPVPGQPPPEPSYRLQDQELVRSYFTHRATAATVTLQLSGGGMTPSIIIPIMHRRYNSDFISVNTLVDYDR